MRAMDGTRLGTSRQSWFWDDTSKRLAPSRWTTCQESLLSEHGVRAQVAHTAHSAHYDSHSGAHNCINKPLAFNDNYNYNRSGEV